MKPRKPRVLFSSLASTGETGTDRFGIAERPGTVQQLKEDYAYSQQMQRDARQQRLP